jgi:NitT/TauT family transport system ATP-binding protein
MTATPLTIGFIPLVDAAAIIVAVEKGFAADEGLDVTLVREVSWANVRDKLNIGLFDAAPLLSPVAVAATLGLSQAKVPLVAAISLDRDGSAVTVSPALHAAIMQAAEGDPRDPMVTARALARVVAARRATGGEPLTFGMTFPFSTHNYQLRLWMAAGGVDPDEDIRLLGLPPPLMADGIAAGHVDGFCVGAPWNAVAVAAGAGRVLHAGSEIAGPVAEKVLAVRAAWAVRHPQTLARLVRAHGRAAGYVADPANRDQVARILGAPDRIGVDPALIRRSLGYGLTGAADGAARPDPAQAAWLYAQMVRWGQAAYTPEALETARGVFRPDLYDAATGTSAPPAGTAARGIVACDGVPFDPAAIPDYLARFPIRRIRD